MCGILGVIGDVDDSKKALDLIKHRGPDNIGEFRAENIFLGHVRLAIIDLDKRSNQPMHLNHLTIIFNGEIYNYKSIKNNLLAKKYTFKTASDTEILLALYDYYGTKMLNEIDGMFAFCIWDNKKKIMFCARDRFGEKPLFYTKTTNKFIVASEIKSILSITNGAKLNRKAIELYLEYKKHIDEPETFFDGVYTLNAGHYMITYNNLEYDIYNYYNLNENITNKNKIKFLDACEEFKSLLITSTKNKLVADVEVASSLSGGLDSSIIVGVTSKQLKLKTFSAINNEPNLDESKWIDDVAAFNNVPSLKISNEFDDITNVIKEITYHQEYPVISSSILMQWSVFKKAKQYNIKVMLDGQGADEFLGGYKDFKYYAIWDLYNNFKIKDYLSERFYFKKHYGEDEKLGLNHLFDPLYKLVNYKRKELLIADNFKKRMIYSIKYELPNLLRYADRNSMAHGIEVRLPYLSRELVEFTLSLPNEFLYKYGTTKYILRESMKEYIPKSVLLRNDKIGFKGPSEHALLKNIYNMYEINIDEIFNKFSIKKSESAFHNFSFYIFILTFENKIIG